ILDPKGDMWLRSYDAISTACYEIYEQWREAGGSDIRSMTTGPRIRTSLEAKIYRSEDFFSGEVNYRIFPRQTRKSLVAELIINHDGDNYKLEQDRLGWYVPLWLLNKQQLDDGLKIPIQSIN